MTIPRPAPLVRTTIDVRIDRADSHLSGKLFGGWGINLPGIF